MRSVRPISGDVVRQTAVQLKDMVRKIEQITRLKRIDVKTMVINVTNIYKYNHLFLVLQSCIVNGRA